MKYNSSTVRVGTPDGTLYLIVMENPLTGQPEKVDIQIGKSGTQIRAWSMAITDLINLCLSVDISIKVIAAYISGNTSDKSRDNEDGRVSSGPEGIVYALLSYLRHKQVDDTGKPYFDFSRLK